MEKEERQEGRRIFKEKKIIECVDGLGMGNRREGNGEENRRKVKG